MKLSPHLIHRRQSFALLGGVGAACLLGGRLSELPTADAASCLSLTAPLEEGPFFVDEKLLRSDIRTDPATSATQAGVLLTLNITVQNQSGASCSALSGAYVDIWQANANGNYSDEAQENTSGQKFLRGYQVTDANGQVQFTTIYPGWYSGRTIHIHIRVRTYSGSTVLDSYETQVFFDDAVTDSVMSLAPYNTRGIRNTRNNNDRVFNSSPAAAMNVLTLTPSGAGYTAVFNLSVAMTTSAVTAGTAAPVAVNPAFGNGLTQKFEFTFTDSAGWQNLSVLNVLINRVLDGRQSCYLAFIPTTSSSGALYLVNDAGDSGGPYAFMSLPGSDSIQNSQCLVAGSGSSVNASGNTLTLTLVITFKPEYAGNHVIYLAAQDKSLTNSGWHAKGTWYVPGVTREGPAVEGMSPARSVGLSNVYTFTFSNNNGNQDYTVVNVLVNDGLDGRNACYIAFVPYGLTAGTLYLVDDAGNAGGPYQILTLPGSGSVENSQCIIHGPGSGMTFTGNNMVLTLAITFKPAFAGDRIFYMAARGNSQNSGWVVGGSVTVG